jgi:hypothetical protein
MATEVATAKRVADEPSLNHIAASATLHCLTGCAAGEVTGMAIGTALGWSNLPTVGLAIGLAFVFGYTLTSVPLMRAGLSLSAVVPIALAADTVSISVMEFIDNAVVLVVPGAMEASLDQPLFWAAVLGGFAVAFGPAFLVNRALIRRGKGCALAHCGHPSLHEPN